MEHDSAIDKAVTNEISTPDEGLLKKFLSLLKSNHGVNIYAVMLLSFALKFPFCFLFGSMLDITRYTHVGNYINLGLNPYLDHETWPIMFWNKYPALFFEIYGFWFLIFGNSVFSIRILFLIGELGTTFVLYLIGKEIRSERIGAVFAFLYSFIPTNFIGFLNGDNDSTPMLFLTLGILFFLRAKYTHSAIFLSLGICFKIFPVFFLFCLVIYFFRRGEYQKITLYIGVLALVFIITSLRFLMLSPIEYLEGIFIHASRASTGYQTSQYVPFLYETKFGINAPFSISISLNFIFQLTILGLISGFFLLHRPNYTPQKLDTVFWGLILYIVLPFVMQRGHFSNWVWVSPFAIIHYFNQERDFLEKNKTKNLFMLLYAGVFWITLLYHNTSIPYSVFQSYQEMTGLESYIIQETMNESAFRVIDLFKMMIFVPWILIFAQKKRSHIYFLISFCVNLLDWSFHYLDFYYWPDQNWSPLFMIYYIIRVILIGFLIVFTISTEKAKKAIYTEHNS